MRIYLLIEETEDGRGEFPHVVLAAYTTMGGLRAAERAWRKEHDTGTGPHRFRGEDGWCSRCGNGITSEVVELHGAVKAAQELAGALEGVLLTGELPGIEPDPSYSRAADRASKALAKAREAKVIE